MNIKERNKFLANSFKKSFPNHIRTEKKYNNIILQYPIIVNSLCSHHLLPIQYTIYFVYIPQQDKLIGFSKIFKIIEFLAQKPQNQENFTNEVINIFMKYLKPNGVGIIVNGKHMCMQIRGIKKDIQNITLSFDGLNKNSRTKIKNYLLNFKNEQKAY